MRSSGDGRRAAAAGGTRYENRRRRPEGPWLGSLEVDKVYVVVQ